MAVFDREDHVVRVYRRAPLDRPKKSLGLFLGAFNDTIEGEWHPAGRLGGSLLDLQLGEIFPQLLAAVALQADSHPGNLNAGDTGVKR